MTLVGLPAPACSGGVLAGNSIRYPLSPKQAATSNRSDRAPQAPNQKVRPYTYNQTATLVCSTLATVRADRSNSRGTLGLTH